MSDRMIESLPVPSIATALADLNALATYLPGFNHEFFGPTAGLVAATPTLVMASPHGGYYAITVDPLPGPLETRARMLWSRPIPITRIGAAFNTCTFTNGVATVTLVGMGAVINANVLVGQFVYNGTDDRSSRAIRVTVVALVGADVVLTLASNYLGTSRVGAVGGVCGEALAIYPTCPPQADEESPVVYGPLLQDDVIIAYADAAYAGTVVEAARSS